MASSKLKYACCCLLFFLSLQLAKAQTISEWFAQKSTQKKYLLAQIEALQQYSSYIRQGYQVAHNGLGSIGGWIKGEFDLHGAYYNSLRRVNPEIRKDPKANECIQYALAIAKVFGGLKVADLDEQTTGYVHSVTVKVLDDTDADIAELELVMTDGKAGFSDDERLKRVDAIHTRLIDKYTFTRNFCDQVKAFINQREQVLKDIETQRRLYDN